MAILIEIYLKYTILYILCLCICGLICFSMAVYFFNALTGDQKEINLPTKFKGQATSKQKAENYSGKGVKTLVRKLKTKRFAKNPIIYKDFRFSSFGPHLYVLQFLCLIGCITVYVIDYMMWPRGLDMTYTMLCSICVKTLSFSLYSASLPYLSFLHMRSFLRRLKITP